MKHLFKALLLAGLNLIASNLSAQTPWINSFNGSGNSNDVANAIATDSAGNVYVAGETWRGTTGYDFATIKYSPAGVALWTNYFTSSGQEVDRPHDIAIGNGNIYVTGESYSTNNGEFGAVTDFVTIAYSSTGTALWTNFYDGPSNLRDSAYAIAVDDAGHVFVTGRSFDITAADDFLTIAYSSTGIALWTNRYDTVEDASAIGIATIGSNYVYVAGTASKGFNDYDYVTIGYTSQGVAVWTNRYDGPSAGGYSYDFASAIGVSHNGTVFVTGASFRTKGITFPYNYYYDYATIAYSTTGTPVWTNRYSLGADHMAHALTVDGNGDVIVTGQSSGYGSGIDYVTIKYSNSGVPAWTNRYNGGSGEDTPRAIAADLFGNVYVAGRSLGNNGSSYDYATVAYSNDGTELWVNRFSSPNSSWEVPNDIAIDADGNVFVTGEGDVGGTPDFLTIKYAAPTTPLAITNCIYIPLFPYTGRRLFSFDVIGPAGANVFIQASTNLQNWVTLETGNLGNGLWHFEDGHFDVPASTLDRRFYRVLRTP